MSVALRRSCVIAVSGLAMALASAAAAAGPPSSGVVPAQGGAEDASGGEAVVRIGDMARFGVLDVSAPADYAMPGYADVAYSWELVEARTMKSMTMAPGSRWR